ncbi:hypothetical protein [Streptomyces virginiae]|uniref:hypothetical protein n=1 Tax=Streptomyces virginiae TaxID=1961 RepID=UPI0037893157
MIEIRRREVTHPFHCSEWPNGIWRALAKRIGPTGLVNVVTTRPHRAASQAALLASPVLPVGGGAAGSFADGSPIADQGGWARHSRSMLGYMQREDGWDDNASAGLT